MIELKINKKAAVHRFCFAWLLIIQKGLFLPLCTSIRIPKFPFSDFISKAPLKLFLSQGNALGFRTLFPSASYSPYVVMCNPFFNLKVALCKVGGIDIVPNP